MATTSEPEPAEKSTSEPEPAEKSTSEPEPAKKSTPETETESETVASDAAAVSETGTASPDAAVPEAVPQAAPEPIRPPSDLGFEPAKTDPGGRSRRRLWRVLGAAAAAALLGLTSVSGYAAWRFDHALHASYPQTSGILRIAGLNAPVQVERDSAGIPQIYAADSGDLFLTEGYVQAQDRFWQMDVSRHYAAGTMASVLGPSWVPHDELARELGWSRIAAASYPTLQPQTQLYLMAFAQGVNDYLDSHPGGSALSIEYSVLGLPDTGTAKDYRPAAWTPVDTLGWLEAMSWDQDAGLDQEVSRSLLTETLSRTEIDQLYPADGADSGFDAWAVAGSRTASGEPLLAAAPVGPPALPSTWYQVGLHCEQVGPSCPYDVAGYTQPGVPGVLLGHDGSIAWSWTGRSTHDSDLFLEKVEGRDYLDDGGEYPLTERQERIDVANGPPRTFTVRTGNHGPLVSDVSALYRRVGAVMPSARSADPTLAVAPGDFSGSYAVAVQSAALQPNTTADALFALDRAGDWADFQSAAAGFTAPAEGMVYADQAGNIGYQGPAGEPVRAEGEDGSWPVPGWDSFYDWGAGEVAPPTEYDPAGGIIAGAPGPAVGVRAVRTATDLTRGRLDATSLGEVQGDTYNPEAAILVPYLLNVHVDDFTSPAVALLRNWDYTEPAASSAAAYYNAVWAELLKLVLGRLLPQDSTNGKPSALMLDDSARWDAVVDSLLTQPSSTWWGGAGPGRGSGRDALLATALEKARLDLTSLMGKNVAAWTWGRVHTMTPENQTLGVGTQPALVKWLLDGSSLELSGGGSDVASAGWQVDSGGFAVATAPELRMIVDLGQFDSSSWIGQTGESGHVDDGDYLDQAPLWASGQTRPWPFAAAAVRATAKQVLQLAPR